MVVTTVVDREDTAAAIATRLVEERLAACVQVGAPVRSTYVWKGRLESAEEWVVSCKTQPGRLEALMARLRALHPYEVPEILAFPVAGGDPDYLAWVAESTSPRLS